MVLGGPSIPFIAEFYATKSAQDKLDIYKTSSQLYMQYFGDSPCETGLPTGRVVTQYAKDF